MALWKINSRTKLLLSVTIGAAVLVSFALVRSGAYKWHKKNAPARAHQEVWDETTQDTVLQAKTAPDLDEMIETALAQGRGNERQRIIVQLSEEKLQRMEEAGVSLADDAAKQEWKSVLADYEGKLKRRLGNMGLIVVELPLSRIRELEQSGDIAYISPDRPVASLGHVDVTTGAAQIRALVSGTTLDGRGISVAVLDSGISNHQSFKLSTVASSVTVHRTYVGTSIATDPHGHGTHVASLIGGKAAFDSGYYTGVAPGVNLLDVRVLDANGAGTSSNVIAALDWCIANKTTYNIRVINMSLGTPARDSYTNDPLCQAARRAVNAGIVVVASAGNYGKNTSGQKAYGGINSPGIDPSVITVGASNTQGTNGRNDDAVASYSSRGPTRGYVTLANGTKKYDDLVKPDLVAPGNKLIGAQALDLQASASSPTGYYGVPNTLITNYSSLLVRMDSSGDGVSTLPTVMSDGTMRLSGTSMAAPVVSGAAAVVLQANPNLTPNLVKAILMYTAQPLAGFNTLEQGAGQVNVDGAVRLARLVKTTLPTTNGTALLTAALPATQASTIAGQSCVWSKGISTNYGFLTGADLMNKWQKMYGLGTILGDGTPYASGALTRSLTMTSGTLSLYSGAVTTNSPGVILGDGTLFVSSTTLVNGLAPGVILGDGTILGDSPGTILGDTGPNNFLLGEGSAAMAPAP